MDEWQLDAMADHDYRMKNEILCPHCHGTGKILPENNLIEQEKAKAVIAVLDEIEWNERDSKCRSLEKIDTIRRRYKKNMNKEI